MKRRIVGLGIGGIMVLMAARVQAGDLTPPGPPAATMRTLQEIYDKLDVIDGKIENAVPKTGQTTSYRAGDDGDLQKGAAWPDPRFTDNEDETVTDNLTGLMWVKAPHDLEGNSDDMEWDAAIDFCNALNFAGHSDWRLPNVRELQSLMEYGRIIPALPPGHPFTGVQSDPSRYWSSTTYDVMTTSAWTVNLFNAAVSPNQKTRTESVWPVRGGH